MGRVAHAADDNETLRKAGHCNRSAMRLLGRARCRTRAAYPYLLLPTREIRKRKEGRSSASAIARHSATKRVIAIVIRALSSVNSQQRRIDRLVRCIDEKRARGRRVVANETTDCERGTGREKEERGKGERDRCGYGYVATPRRASQRAHCRLTDPPDPTIARFAGA